MVLWIVIGVVVLGLLLLALSVRALVQRLGPLQAEQLRLQAGLIKAQELAQVAQGLQAHADSLKLRADLAAEQIERIKETRAEFGPGSIRSIRPKRSLSANRSTSAGRRRFRS